ncbi:MAG: T9SS type A sorting domain-containing protein [Muribaculaceae bacterium]|nr:T9SS type A sorting domain-containing protein [Muribaculaceae bacterium]
MKQFLLSGFVIAASLSIHAQETFNFFDPADCDENGWLWLDSAEKIAKYVGKDRKIQLLNAPYQIDDPEFPGETIFPASFADPEVKGFNTSGEAGGEGSKTGALVLAAAEGRGWFDYQGGGMLIHLPDCYSYDVVLSSVEPSFYTEIHGARSYVEAKDCQYIWNEADPNFLNPDDGPLTTEHYVEYLNVQEHKYDLSFGEGDTRDYLTFAGEKGENRTTVFYNRVAAPLYVHAVRIKTFTDVSGNNDDLMAGVEEAVAGVNTLTVSGKVVYSASPTTISVYNTAGSKVASVYGTSLDCSGLPSGIYIIRGGKDTLKVVF